ncbi:MAG: hypothetical protein P8Y69_04140 [Gammaproteobacteria bacterium]
MIVCIRNIRGEANINPGTEIEILLQGGGPSDRELAAATAPLLKRLAKVTGIGWLGDAETPPPNALALVGELKVMVPLAGLIDVAAERARLTKEIDRLKQELARSEKKLSNESFVSKAPKEVVERERMKAEETSSASAVLQRQLDSLDDLD